jgi:sulfide dehydrogenase [flavocytochrome c] flavoprotein subunit
MKRRTVLAGALAAPFVARAQDMPQGTARVVVVGGGFAGATAARMLAQAGHQVTLVEAEAQYVSCPFSNPVVAGLRELDGQQFGWDKVAASGVKLVQARATGVDGAAKRVMLDGGAVEYDRLVMAPGVDMRLGGDPGALPGYDRAAAERMPHAWKAGAQTTLLRDQLRAMPDGGTVVMAVPANPYRCPPGPYERASLIAWYLKNNKPRSKLLVLDAKDQFSKQKLFQQAWAQMYPGLLEWVPLSNGGAVTGVDPAAMTLSTDFDTHKADVANVIPPQRAGAIAQAAGVADRTGWCPVDPVSFESLRVPNIHVIGDAAIMGAMPKSAFAANAEAKVCAQAITVLLAGRAPEVPRLINTCYSLVAPEYGISVAGVYRPVNGQLTDIDGAGGTSPLDAAPAVRAQEAAYADVWYHTIMGSVFG